MRKPACRTAPASASAGSGCHSATWRSSAGSTGTGLRIVVSDRSRCVRFDVAGA
jgi:hypothetical protein